MALWFPRLGTDRLCRRGRGTGPLVDGRSGELAGDPAGDWDGTGPFATVVELGQARHLSAVTAAAEAVGLRRGMALADARAICPDLATRPAAPRAETAFLAALARWAGRYSPFVACDGGEDGTGGLMLDITGVAHLFGGEPGLAAQAGEELTALGVAARLGLADTPGAAWALARFGGMAPTAARSGDAIDQEAYATRARAAKRGRPGAAIRPAKPTAGTPMPGKAAGGAVRSARPHSAAPGETLAALAPLPVAALRLSEETVAGLARLGLRQITDLVGLPRGAVARRFGVEALRRLDQALGAEPEPIAPMRPRPGFALRLSLPEPIGLASDIEAGIARLLPPLCARLETAGMGARRVRLELRRVDAEMQVIEAGLARPSRAPDRIAPLLALKIDGIDAGFGIDMLRLSVPAAEPLALTQHKGGLAADAEARARLGAGGDSFSELMGRLGARVGLDALQRLHPADSHIPEKTASTVAAAFVGPAPHWPAPPAPRPMVLFAPEAVRVTGGRPPETLRWRRLLLTLVWAEGPERIAPEWWLDDPAWRSGLRDYWRIETADGTRLWLFEARGGDTAGGWFVHGIFA
ncbi:MAG: DNA polymerase Y family protein [Pseudomonadota bacterium]